MKLSEQDYILVKIGLNNLRDALPFDYEIGGKKTEITDEMISEAEEVIDNIGTY